MSNFLKTNTTDNLVEKIKEYGIVVVEDVSFDDYVKIVNQIGYIDSQRIWASVTDYNYIWQVTNRKIIDNRQGLFKDQHIDWHSNITYSLDGAECIALRSHHINKDNCSPTTFSNSLQYFKSLDSDYQKYLDTLYIKYTYDHTKTFEGIYSNVHNAADDSLTSDLNQEIVNQAKNQSIKNALNIPSNEKDLYKEGRHSLEGFWKLVPNHPLGMRGLFFPHLHVVDIVDSDFNSINNAHEIYNNLKEDLITSNRYHYVHNWKQNDLILADQLTGIHKRDNPTTGSIREMHLVQFWYQTKDRVHYDYSL